jgi:hypothetical protein
MTDTLLVLWAAICGGWTIVLLTCSLALWVTTKDFERHRRRRSSPPFNRQAAPPTVAALTPKNKRKGP